MKSCRLQRGGEHSSEGIQDARAYTFLVLSVYHECIHAQKKLSINLFSFIHELASFLFFFSAAINVMPSLPSTKLALLKSVPLAFLVKFAVTFDEVCFCLASMAVK